MALVASAEGGDHVAALARRHRSESEARMLMHTVRSSGWCSLLVLKELASWSCCSLGPAGAATMAPSMPGAAMAVAAIICGFCAAMTSAGMVRVCCSCADRSRGSVRTDMVRSECVVGEEKKLFSFLVTHCSPPRGYVQNP
jgi:hypothetical protein